MKITLLTLGFVLSMYSLAWAAGNSGAAHAPRHGANLNLLPPPAPDANKVTRPDPVVLEAPAAMSKVSGSATTLKWKPAQGATAYSVQVATDPNFKWLVVNEQSVQGTTYELKNLEVGKQYFWRVYGTKADNDPSYLKGDFGRSMFEVR
ncbi:MAG: fibronectin type III domain-containing protein [Bdellovibrio sp.]